MTNEDQHLRERDEVAQELQIKRIEQAKLNAAEWGRRATVAVLKGHELVQGGDLKAANDCYKMATRLDLQAAEELKRHGH